MLKALVILCQLLSVCKAYQTARIPKKSSFQNRKFLLTSQATETPVKRQSVESEACELPNLLKDMVDERREFELNLGKAMDVLRKEYPSMLYNVPDLSIYRPDLKVKDPSGVQLSGLPNYENAFRFLHTFIGLFFNINRSTLQSRIVYDFARSSIKVSWNAMLMPKIVGNTQNAVYIDGISVYKLDITGKIEEHRVERILMNDVPMQPPYSYLEMYNQVTGVNVPIGAMISSR